MSPIATMQRGFAWLGVLLGLLLSLLAGALVFVLFTTSGAQLSLSLAQRVTGGMVAADGVDGNLWGRLSVQHLQLHLKAADVAVEDAELEAVWLALLGNRLEITQLHAARVQVLLKPTPPDDTPPISELPFGLVLHAAKVGQLRIAEQNAPPGSVPIALDAIELAASWRGPQVVIDHAAVTTPWVGRVQFTGKTQLHGDGVDIENLQTQGFAVATLQGRFGYGTPSNLHLIWKSIRWPPVDPAQAETASDLDSGGGEAHWSGLLDDYRYDLKGALRLPQIALQVAARGRGSLSAVQIEQLHAAALDGTLDASVRVGWRDGVRIDGAGRFANLNPQALLADLPGHLNGHFEAQTQIIKGRPEVRFSAQLEKSTLRDYPLTLDAAGHYAGETLRFDTLKLISGSVHVDAAGQVLPTLAAQARVDAANLADAWPGLGGSLTATLRADGDLHLPHVIADLQAQQLKYQDLRLASLKLQGDVDPKRQIDLDLTLGALDAGTQLQSAQLAIHGPIDAHRIELSVKGDPGAVTLSAQGAFDAKKQAWRGELQTAQIAPQQLAAWTLEQPTAVAVSGSDANFDPMCWRAGSARACIGLKSDRGKRRIDVAVSDFALSYLQPFMPGGAEVSVVVHGSGYAELGEQGLQDLRADIATDAGQWQLGGLPPIELKPAHLSIRDEGEGSLIDLDFPFASGGFTLKARLAPGPIFLERSIAGQLHIAMPDLAWLRLVNVEVAEAAGTLGGDIQLSGTLAKPLPQGHLALSDGRFKLVTPGIQLSDVGLRIDGEGQQPLQVVAEASSGDGKLNLSGSINPWHDPLALDLKLTGDNFQAVNTREARVQVSPDLRIRLGDQLLDVSGVIAVPKAGITPKSLGDGSVSASSDQVMVGKDLGAQQRKNLRISADVTLKLGDDVQFDGFGLKTQLSGSVQAFEQPGVPTRARGEINLIGGHYKAYGQDLTIETGKLLFNDGPVTEPALELRATRKPTDDITVGLYVRGTLKKPDFKLFSTPTMPQDQQLGWLILGRAINDTTSSADKAAVGGAATSLGLAGGAWIAQQLGNKVGIDEVTVGTKPGQTNDQAMFTVGKYLSPKLFIAYGVGLFQPGHTFKLQYTLGGGFKVQTETGVDSGGDVLYTIERK